VIKTDLLWVSLAKLLQQNPFSGLAILFWWTRGRAYLKKQIAQRVNVDPAALPYNAPLIDFLAKEKATGRPLFLVTASDAKLARDVFDYLKLFRELLASDGTTNLRGKTKARLLVERFGRRGFDYAGNSRVDLPVWADARQAIVVGSARLAAKAAERTTVAKVFERQVACQHSAP
jgi:hypothetical protein